ncbi:DUF3304 domain-containing protein [Burkholderia stabilis]|uniref:DUF3304 domain-containing protein n=1 Tax=Burkholderia stabilis TaxID=95485 RepID=A0AAJ5NGK2_9BURK|nr:DUF3304 domain-containing protein [Burkholderia stabilis]VBB14435.1 Protein of unknown function (DUF3304) [Burkholderia stabilis]
MKINRLNGLALVLLVLLAGCAGLRADELSAAQTPKRVELSSGGTKTLNYTPWYIHTFSISGPKGSGIGGGGPNVMPMRVDGRPSGGGAETCCTSYPREWQADLRVTVRWVVDKKMDSKTLGYWYKAENVRIPQYDGSRSGGVWAIFLPGDRVKLMVADGNANGHNSVAVRPTDDDLYVVKGALDDEWNRLYR